MHDLFLTEQSLRPLPLPDAEVWHLPVMPLPAPPEVLLARLIADTPWRAERITVWGKPHRQPRLSAWYGDPGSRYAYSGIELAPMPWSETLQSLRRAVKAASGAAFNSVLLNYYRDHRDSMGLHSDDEPELGSEPLIASLSLGETRTFTLKHRRRRDIEPVKLPLESGSLLLMKGPTQRNWKHGVARQSRPCGPRVNLTFRRVRHCIEQACPGSRNSTRDRGRMPTSQDTAAHIRHASRRETERSN